MRWAVTNDQDQPSPTPKEKCKYDTVELLIWGYYLLLKLVLMPEDLSMGTTALFSKPELKG